MKVSHLGETKRLKMTQDYLDLVAQTQKAFNMPTLAAIKFYYLDEENELISINSQEDLVEALSIEDLPSLKLTIAQSLPEARALLMGQTFPTIQDDNQIKTESQEHYEESFIDSDTEDLDGEKSEVVVKPVEPYACSTQETEVKVGEPVGESSEEDRVEKEVACWKCNGSKKNKKGNQCKKCDGTGLIQKDIRTWVQESY